MTNQSTANWSDVYSRSRHQLQSNKYIQSQLYESQVPYYSSKQMQETYGGPGGRGNESGTCEHFEVVVIWSI